MNVISKSAVESFGLKPEPHPSPFQVGWVDKTSLPVRECCLVTHQIGSYSEKSIVKFYL